MFNPHELVELHISELDSFACGYLIGEDEGFYVLESIDDQGHFGSYTLLRSEYVSEIVRESNYLDLMEFSVSAQKEKDSYYNLGELDNTLSSLNDFIQNSIEGEKLVELAINSEEFTVIALINDYDGETLTIQPVDLEDYSLMAQENVLTEDISEFSFESVNNVLLKEFMLKNGKIEIAL